MKTTIEKKIEELAKECYYDSVDIELEVLCEMKGFADWSFDASFETWISEDKERNQIYCFAVYQTLNRIEKELNKILELTEENK